MSHPRTEYEVCYYHARRQEWWSRTFHDLERALVYRTRLVRIGVHSTIHIY